MLLLRMAQLPRLESLPAIMEKLSAIEEKIGNNSGPSLSLSESNYTASSNRTLASRAPASNSKGSHSGEEQQKGEMPLADVGAREGSLKEGQPAMPVEGLHEKPLYPESNSSLQGGSHDSSMGVALPTSSSVHEGELSAVTLATPVDQVVERWHRFVEWLMSRDPILGAKLNGSTIQADDETSLILEVSELFAEKLKDAQSLEKLSLAAADFFGVNYLWAIRSKNDVKEQVKRPKTPTASKANPKRTVMEHPMVLQALEMLGGELVEIKAMKPEKAPRKF
jgi:DNA polymerase-3 subunit gamma/tau